MGHVSHATSAKVNICFTLRWPNKEDEDSSSTGPAQDKQGEHQKHNHHVMTERCCQHSHAKLVVTGAEEAMTETLLSSGGVDSDVGTLWGQRSSTILNAAICGFYKGVSPQALLVVVLWFKEENNPKRISDLFYYYKLKTDAFVQIELLQDVSAGTCHCLVIYCTNLVVNGKCIEHYHFPWDQTLFCCYL